MPKSSSDRRVALSFAAAAAVFFAAAAAFEAIVVYEVVHRNQFRSGSFTYGVLIAIAGVGLAKRRYWGRGMAVLITLIFAGIGVLDLASVVFTRKGSFVVGLIVLVASLVVSFWLSRPVFAVAPREPGWGNRG